MTTIESRPDTVAPALARGPIDAARRHPHVDRRFIDIFTSTRPQGHRPSLLLLRPRRAGSPSCVVNVLIGIERLDGTDGALDTEVIPQLLDAQRVGLVFAVLLPLALGDAIALVPLQVGARSIVFPRLAFAGFWMWLGGVDRHHRRPRQQRRSLGGDSDMVDLFIAGLGLMAIGLLATAGAVATSVLTTRAPGMTMRRIPRRRGRRSCSASASCS